VQKGKNAERATEMNLKRLSLIAMLLKTRIKTSRGSRGRRARKEKGGTKEQDVRRKDW